MAHVGRVAVEVGGDAEGKVSRQQIVMMQNYMLKLIGEVFS